MLKANLNDYVKFKLTENGYKILEDHILYLCNLVGNPLVNKNHFLKIDENGFEYMQLWEFMRIFGNHMRNGQNAIVENNNMYFEINS